MDLILRSIRKTIWSYKVKHYQTLSSEKKEKSNFFQIVKHFSYVHDVYITRTH